MENTYYFGDERKARDFCWEILKLYPGKAKIDNVVVAGDPPSGFAISVWYLSEETESLIAGSARHYTWNIADEHGEGLDGDDDGYLEKKLVRVDAALLEAVAKGSLIKAKLMDDPEACDDVDGIVFALAMALAETSPGPSNETLNFVMRKTNGEERFMSL